ncbi:TetR/AcrR family transcriptional regulator [Burkholderia pyrrocinia]|uniref:TetR/AcrR family transcriptional regulator n=1 Tax=Burkholderia pyrrocinia TaxID=60550 RepID=UPI001F2160FD|nr:TetR/AcrR family transcriptional regulator [Burkholderia pyrrocinia]
MQRLLDVARRQFLTAGYRETSLEGIAREAGVAKKTLYGRFGSKAGLFATIVDTLRRSWVAELQGLVLESNRPETVLETVALHLLEVGTRPDMIELYRLLLLDAHRVPELIRGYYDKGGGLSGMEPLSDYLREAVAERVLTIEDVTLATEQFVYLVLGGIRTRMLLGAARRPNASARARIARQAVRIFLAGCAT